MAMLSQPVEGVQLIAKLASSPFGKSRGEVAKMLTQSAECLSLPHRTHSQSIGQSSIEQSPDLAFFDE